MGETNKKVIEIIFTSKIGKHFSNGIDKIIKTGGPYAGRKISGYTFNITNGQFNGRVQFELCQSDVEIADALVDFKKQMIELSESFKSE